MWQSVYEQVVQFASKGALTEELSLARDEYLQLTGELFESDDNFEQRVTAYLEWYAIERPLADGTTPLTQFAQEYLDTLSDPVQKALGAIQASWMSVFEIVSQSKDGHVTIRDLLTDTEYLLRAQPYLVGLSVRDIFVARLIFDEAQWQLTDCLTYLPREARSAILYQCRPVYLRSLSRCDRTQTVMKLLFHANRARRYRHVDAQKIFSSAIDDLRLLSGRDNNKPDKERNRYHHGGQAK